MRTILVLFHDATHQYGCLHEYRRDNLHILNYITYIYTVILTMYSHSVGVNEVTKRQRHCKMRLGKLEPVASRKGVDWVHRSLCSVCLFQLKGK